MSLDISLLLNAIAHLHEGWQRYQLDISDIQIRDGLVQRFVFTYEISHTYDEDIALQVVAGIPDLSARQSFWPVSYSNG